MELKLLKNMKSSNVTVTTAKPRCHAKCRERESEDQNLSTFMKYKLAN